MNLITIKLLVETARQMWDDNVPSMTKNGSGHWSGLKSEIEEHIGRPMTSAEICCLSLSRCFGNTSLLTSEESARIMKFLWPQGNPKGRVIDWDILAERLNDYAKI